MNQPLHQRSDRRVHAYLADGREIVRYDRQGKWYVEAHDGRQAMRFADIVDLALREGVAFNFGRCGGGAFDRQVRPYVKDDQ